MPKQERPITERPNPAEGSVQEPREHHGKHREDDEALPGTGSTKGGLNKGSGAGQKQNTGKPKGDSGKPRGLRE
jgi:hypothetical protein